MKTKIVTKLSFALCVVLLAALLLPALVWADFTPKAVAEEATVTLNNEDLYRYRYVSKVEQAPKQYAFTDLADISKSENIDNKLTALQSASKSLTILKFVTKVGGAILPPSALKVFVNKLPDLFENTKRLFVNSYIFETGHSAQDNFAILSENMDELYTSLSKQMTEQTQLMTQQMQDMANYILQQLELKDYGATINDFASVGFGSDTGYYKWKKSLYDNYNALSKLLGTPHSDPNETKIAYDMLYVEAARASNLWSKIIPNENGVPTDYSILDVMYKYYLYSQNTNYDAIFNSVQTCIDFAEDLYSTYLFANTCLALCYQHMIDDIGLDDSGNPQKNYYTLSDTINSDNRSISYSTQIKPYVEKEAEAQSEQLSAFVASYYAKLLNLDQYYNVEKDGYNQKVVRNEVTTSATSNGVKINGTDNYLSVNDKVQKGAKIYLPSLPVELTYLLDGESAFAVNNANATVSDDGVVTVTADRGSFDVTLKWGSRTVYTQHFEINDMPFAGNGTPQSPYVITNENQLLSVVGNTNLWSTGNNFVLANDITLSRDLPNPIGTLNNYFYGNFDGDFHTVYNVKGYPLFGYNGGTIQNVTIGNANVTRYVDNPNDSGVEHGYIYRWGGLAIRNMGTMRNCHIKDSTVDISFVIQSDYAHVELFAGAIVGANEGGALMKNCSATHVTLNTYCANVFNGKGIEQVHNYTGGIAAYNNGTAEDCLSANNTINLKIKTVSVYYDTPFTSAKRYPCDAFYRLGGAFGLVDNGGVANRCVSYSNTKSNRWDWEVYVKKTWSTNWVIDNSYASKYDLVHEQANVQPFAGIANGNLNTCLCDETSDKTQTLTSAGNAETQLNQNGWNWNGGRPVLAQTDGEVYLASAPTKNYYKVGENFNPAGIKLIVNGEAVTNGLTFDGFKSDLSVRNTFVTVHAYWHGQSVSFDVYVSCPHTQLNREDTDEQNDNVPGIRHKVTCTECNEIISNVWEPTGSGVHNWDDGRVTKQPNCTEWGTKLYTCTDQDCNATYTENLAPLGHLWTTPDSSTQPTCTQSGSRHYTCERCHEAERTETLQPTGHDYQQTDYQAPDCTTAGYTEYTCQNEYCGSSYKEVIPALQHDFHKDEATSQDPTCTDKGRIDYKCGRCNETKTEEVAALGHNYQPDHADQPTCTEDGRQYYKCENCDEQYIEVLSKTGHDMTKFDSKAATYEEAGNYDYYKCGNCNKYFKDADGNDEYESNAWLIPALGNGKKFVDEMFSADLEKFGDLAAALTTYNTLTPSEKNEEDVKTQYARLQEAITDYNARMGTLNKSQQEASNAVSATLGAIGGLSALVALAFVCKRYF